ncbi:MAG: SOS response-associated peptidase [Vulcanimicrobiota bacterium]
MCGRYALVLSGKIADLPFVEISDQLELELPWECYNVAPTMKVPILDSDNRLKFSTWGLIPHWAKEPPKRPLINARVETASEKPSFRDAYRSHRCAVPSSGFFEWTGSSKERMPHFIPPAGGDLLWFAGLACLRKGPHPILSHTVLTRSSEETRVARLHDRCPVTLSQDSLEPWLQGEVGWEELKGGDPFAEPFRVTGRVNKADHDSPENLQPLEEVL